ncbi:MAG: hypothetical protein WC465_00235 [Patescibacteria group bacterium]
MNQIECTINVMNLLLSQWMFFDQISNPFFYIDIDIFADAAGGRANLVKIIEDFERRKCVKNVRGVNDTSEWRTIILSNGDRLSLNIMQDNLEYYREVLKKNIANKNISLSNFDISYDEDRKILIIGNEEILIDNSTNQDYLCKIMFKRGVGVPVYWVDIYEAIQGGHEPENDKKCKKIIEDTVYMVNNKVRGLIGTNDLLFRSNKGYIIRQY